MHISKAGYLDDNKDLHIFRRNGCSCAVYERVISLQNMYTVF